MVGIKVALSHVKVIQVGCTACLHFSSHSARSAGLASVFLQSEIEIPAEIPGLGDEIVVVPHACKGDQCGQKKSAVFRNCMIF